jgi:Raf kinase inhibitor-like YbhB/YbcL family protein
MLSRLFAGVLAAAFAVSAEAASVSGLAISDPDLKGSKTLDLSSSAFAARGAIPDVFTSYGQGVSPPLAWGKGPYGTRSFALIVEDPDAPTPAPFIHWMVWNIPSSVQGLAKGVIAPGARQGKLMYVDKTGYMGPRPPPGGAHHYHFQLFALDTELQLANGAERAQLVDAMKGHVLASDDLVATYRKP